MGGALDVLRLGAENLRRHLIAMQFIEQIQHLLQKRGLLGRAAVHLQHGRHLGQRLLQRQQLAAAVQRHLGEPAGDAQHPVTQAAEAQHLRVAAGGRTADAAEVHLRLVRGVLRHQQDLPAVVSQLRNAVQERI